MSLQPSLYDVPVGSKAMVLWSKLIGWWRTRRQAQPDWEMAVMGLHSDDWLGESNER